MGNRLGAVTHDCPPVLAKGATWGEAAVEYELGGLKMTDSRITTYVDAALAQLRRQDLMYCPGGLPDEMRDDSIMPVSGWIGWKAMPSTVADADLDVLEREAKLAFPPLYRDFLKYRHFVTLTERGLAFERHLNQGWLANLRRSYFASWPRERIVDIGLLPFGRESQMDAGPVCFDTRYRFADGDCPIVFWDHEWIDTANEVRPMFSSSAKMFQCLAAFAATDLDFTYHDEDDDPSTLPLKRALLADFLAMDPAGAGGPARGYWTSWGVDGAG
jgi:hypothetical protein